MKSATLCCSILLCFTLLSAYGADQTKLAISPANGSSGKGWNADYVFPGAIRSVYAFAKDGLQEIKWTTTCGTLSAKTGPYVAWTAPASAQDCVITAMTTGSEPQTASTTISTISEKVHVHIMPFTAVLYRNQIADFQSYVQGTSEANSDVVWTVSGGNVIGDAADRDLAWSSDKPGTYILTATSVKDRSKQAIAYAYVTDRPLPENRVNGTLPVDPDCVKWHDGEGRCIDIGGNSSKFADLTAWFSAGNQLKAGDTVRYWAAGGPYYEQLMVTQKGAMGKPIRIVGVPDDKGRLPEINGSSAHAANPAERGWYGTQKSCSQGNLQYCGIINTADNRSDYRSPSGTAQYILFEGLDVRQARRTDKFHDRNDKTEQSYSTQTGGTCFRINYGYDIVVRGNEISNCGAWGVFSNAGAPKSRMVERVTLEGNYIHDNATPKNWSLHNVYLQSDGVLVQFNYFGHATPGSLGSDAKFRSAGIYNRYNYYEAEQRILDYVEPQDSGAYFFTYIWWPYHLNVDPRDETTITDVASTEEKLQNNYTYGNEFHNANGYCSNCFHYGWDQVYQHAPGGTLWFYFNTYMLDTTYPGGYYGTTFWDSGDNTQTRLPQYPYAQALNNIIYRVDPSKRILPPFFSWTRDSSARLTLGTNYIDSNWGDGNGTPGEGHDCPKAADVNNLWMGAAERCHVVNSDAAHYIHSKEAPIDHETYAGGSVTRNQAGSIPAELQHLKPKLVYHPATRRYEPRNDRLTDLGAVPYQHPERTSNSTK